MFMLYDIVFARADSFIHFLAVFAQQVDAGFNCASMSMGERSPVTMNDIPYLIQGSSQWYHHPTTGDRDAHHPIAKDAATVA